MSPEMVNSTFENNFKQDVWSMGVALFVMIFKDKGNYFEESDFPLTKAEQYKYCQQI